MRAHRRFYQGPGGRTDAYALNAGHAEGFSALVDELRLLLQPGRADVVLDLGGGNGRLSAEVFKGCRNVVVLDLHTPDMRTGHAFVAGDMHRPPFQARTFTTIFSHSTFPHVGSTTAGAKMLREWDRLLTPDGVLFVGDIPDRSKLPRMLSRGFGRRPFLNSLKYYFAVSMISTFSRRALKRHLERMGYAVRLIELPRTRRFCGERFDLLARKPGRA